MRRALVGLTLAGVALMGASNGAYAAPMVAGQATPAMPSCVLLDPLMADQGLTWLSLPCMYRGDAVTPPFVIGAQPVKGWA